MKMGAIMMLKNILLVTGFVLLMSSREAFAHDDAQVWRDSEGQIIHNTWGACVRSRWAIDHDACAQFTQRTVIGEEDRTIYFGFDGADLTEESRKRLDTLVDQLTSAHDVTDVRIVGYADRIGTISYNKALSEKRAEVVRSYIIADGFAKPSTTETHWVGKSEPSTHCSNSLPHEQLIQCLQPDRKVTVELGYSIKTQVER